MKLSRKTRRGMGMACLAGVTATALAATGAVAAGTITPTTDASALAGAMVTSPEWVAGAEIVTAPPGGVTTGVVTGDLAGFPLHGDSAIVLSSGYADSYTHGISSDMNGYGQSRGDSDFDVTVLRVDLAVPEGVNCLLGLDFRFLSMEWPDYLGTEFNDAFIAEVGESTWTTSGSEIHAPGNFAFDPSGSPISINAAGFTSMAPEHATDTPFSAHAATPLLTAATPLEPGPVSLYLSIFDQGDTVLDSAVLIDNLRLGTVQDPVTQCVPGAQPADDAEVNFRVEPEQINLRGKGVTPMVIYGSESFDVSLLDASSLQVGPAGATPEKWHYTDADEDGHLDLKFHVRTQALGLQPGAEEVCLSVARLDGTQLEACDEVRVRG